MVTVDLLLLLLLCFHFRIGYCQGDASDGVVIAQADLQGLQAFRAALVDRRNLLASWNGTGLDACSGAWTGIRCVNGKVIAIQLPFKGLGGTLSDKVAQLSALRKLSIHDNALAGQIPAALAFLPDLRGLYLFNNRFSGTIPPSLGACAALQTLDLSNNRLIGGVPSSLANATNLYRLNLAGNNLTGVIPADLTALPSLAFLLLAGNALAGEIPADIGLLHKLQELDLSSNNLAGTLPDSLFNLSSLDALGLAGNRLAGALPASIAGLQGLSRLSLKGNRFDGDIPPELASLPSLSDLDLSENNFSGEIPPALGNLTKLSAFNVSYNNLSGPVPVLLAQKFNSTSFLGNLQLCGYSASSPPCPPLSPSSSPTPSTPGPSTPGTRKLSKREIILAAAGIGLLFLLLILCVIVLCLCKRGRGDASGGGTSEKKGETGAATATASRSAKGGAGTAVSTESTDGGGKLVHFDGPLAFTADDLLCATAEIMGKSTYGTVYKATLEDGNQVAVKRLREKTARGAKEFEAEVSTLGKIRHPNLLALRAFYLGPKGEKLLVFDFMPKGSLAAFLHARGVDTTVSWATRMNIALGVARGLQHLHASGMVHGNLTSSNILLDDDVNPKIADYGLSRLMNTSASSNVIATAGALGYRAPELSKMKKANAKTDVYSLGVVILELLTGKAPSDTNNGLELPQWVASVVEEEWTHEVFDVELIRDAAAGSDTGDELVNTLKVALHCVDPSPVARPELKQVIKQLEEIMPSLAAPAEPSSVGEGEHSVADDAKPSE